MLIGKCSKCMNKFILFVASFTGHATRFVRDAIMTLFQTKYSKLVSKPI